jgi:NAD(P)-dependent dehydrogenase (short-subunit alcohol dehydrogenase family)
MADTKRVWLVTGTSSGFGRAIAEAVVANGDQLVAAVRRPEANQDLAAQAPSRVQVVPTDVTDRAQLRAAVDTAVDAFGRIDVVVHNAGYGLLAGIEEATDEQIRAQHDVNLFSVFELTRYVLPVMRRQHSGHLIFLSSVAGQLGAPGLAWYDATKFAVEGFAEALAAEAQPINVKVTIFEPGNFRTGWAGRSMVKAEPVGAYAPAIDPVRELFAGLDGNQPGDPAKVAQAMLRVVAESEPPLRLVMGADALDMIRDKLERQAQEMATWEWLSTDSEFAATD